ncbi:hypothetical protein Neosp_009591 [[Neocosmospora] mangrovei]
MPSANKAHLESDDEFAALWRDEFLDTRLIDEEDETQDASQDKFDSKFNHLPASFLDNIDEEDRRLPLQYFKWSDRILFRSTSCDPGTDYRTVLRQEPAHGQYAAEVVTSKFLQQELGSLYKPDDHWTSPQRYKAGYRRYPHPVASCATFTIADREASRKFSGVLSQRGFEEANTWAWTNSDPTYHLDMAVSSGGSTSDFAWTSQQFERIRVHDALPEEWPKDLARMPETWRKRGLPPPDDPIWAEIGALFERPWFERAWIIQELLVATSVRVICGKWMIDWNDLLTVIRVITRASPPLPEQAQGKAQGKFSRFSKLAKCREGEAKHERRPILDLLEDFRDSKSSIDHDRFFCLLGLANDGNNKGFVVDYRLSFDVIVRKYAWAFIEQGKVLELLHRGGINSRKKDSFPSWIPDWTVPKPSSLRTLQAQSMPYAASKRPSPRLDTSPMNDLELRLYGFRVDEIESISETSNVAEQLGLYIDEVDRMIASSSYHREGDLKWKAPIAGAWRRRSDGHSMKSSYLALRDYLGIDTDNSEEGKAWTKVEGKAGSKAKSTSGKDPNHTAESRDSLWARGQDYYLALQGNLTGWKFVVTKQHRVGIVPPTAKKGDVVFVIHGGVVPFLLRKEEAFRGSFSLVGECYIHGLMNNEAETLCATSEQVITLR